MSPQSLVTGLIHWLGLIALAAVIGGLGIDRLILPAAAEVQASRDRLRRWITGLLCLLLLLTIADLLIRAQDRKSTRLNSSHLGISYAVFCLKKKKQKNTA